MADATDAAGLALAIEGVDAVVSGLGLVKGSPPDLLTSAATALVALPGRPRVVWLGAFGTGRSAAKTGPAVRALLKLALNKEIPDKTGAEELILANGGTVVHAGPLTNGPIREGFRVVPLDQLTGRRLPRPVCVLSRQRIFHRRRVSTAVHPPHCKDL